MRPRHKSNTVYSSELGRICPSCGLPVSECPQHKERPKAASDGIVRVRREAKGRRGKTVTTVSGVPLDDPELLQFASRLKRLCGTGGTVKDGIIIIQGDHVDVLIAELEKKEYIVKNAGG